jgi:hypothetical protein
VLIFADTWTGMAFVLFAEGPPIVSDALRIGRIWYAGTAGLSPSVTKRPPMVVPSRDNTPIPSRWQAAWGSVTVALVAQISAPCHERGAAVGDEQLGQATGGPGGQGTACGPVAQASALRAAGHGLQIG